MRTPPWRNAHKWISLNWLFYSESCYVCMQNMLEHDADNHLKQLVDNAKSKLENYVIAFASVNEDKVNFVVAVDKAITDKYNAGKLVNVLATVCDGRGGGRPDMAQAGAKNKDNIDKAFEELLANI